MDAIVIQQFNILLIQKDQLFSLILHNTPTKYIRTRADLNTSRSVTMLESIGNSSERRYKNLQSTGELAFLCPFHVAQHFENGFRRLYSSYSLIIVRCNLYQIEGDDPMAANLAEKI